jgi:hypothetical protein
MQNSKTTDEVPSELSRFPQLPGVQSIPRCSLPEEVRPRHIKAIDSRMRNRASFMAGQLLNKIQHAQPTKV